MQTKLKDRPVSTMKRRAFLAGAATLFAPPALAIETVSAALVLAVDVSSSLTDEYWLLQRQGYIDAMLEPEVLRAIIGTPHRKIALTYFEWAGSYSQRVILPWTIIGNDGDAERVAGVLNEKQRPFEGATGVGAALAYSEMLLSICPFPADHKVVDVSGDGASNDGQDPDAVRDRMVDAGVKINGLPIDWARSHPPQGMSVEDYYRNSIVGGTGAFCMPATGFETFGYAVAAKLRYEVS